MSEEKIKKVQLRTAVESRAVKLWIDFNQLEKQGIKLTPRDRKVMEALEDHPCVAQHLI